MTSAGWIALPARELEQVFHPRQDGSVLRRADHGDPPAAAELQQSFVSEDVQGPQHGVLVHPEHGSDVLGEGQAVSGASLAVGDGAPDLRGNLVVQRERSRPVEVDIQHGPSDSSSMMKAGQERGSLLIDAPGREGARSARIQALFEEARRRGRRRRLTYAAISMILAIAAALGLTVGWQHGDAAQAHRGHAPRVGTETPTFTLPTATVAWVDYQGQLHVGQVATRAQHIVASVAALAGIGRLLQADGRLYAAGSAVIRQFNIATGAVRQVARGDGIFASADGQRLYITRNSAGLLEISADGAGASVS